MANNIGYTVFSALPLTVTGVGETAVFMYGEKVVSYE
jgi:hypothetical protein